jgi:tetratricopeptide (TPR) repeat protein
MKRFVGTLAMASLILALWVTTTGCEKDAPTLAHEGSIHFLQKQYPEAIKSFDAALALNPKNFEAQIGLAEVYTEKGDHAKAHQYFEKVYAGKLDKGRQLYVDTRFQNLLVSEAEAMPDKTSDAYEAALRKIIDTRNRGQAADKAYDYLGKYYLERGDALAKDKKTRGQAAEFYQKMKSIRTTRELRKQALDKAESLFRAIFKDEFAGRVAADKATWAEGSAWTEAGGRLTFTSTIEDKGIKFKEDAEKAPYQRKLSLTCQKALILAMHKYSGTTPPDPLLNYKLQTSKLDAESYEKGKVSMTVSVTLGELEDLSYRRLVKPARKKKGKKPAKGDAPAKKDAAPASAPADDKAAPAGDKAAPAGDKAAPADDKAAPAGDKAAPAGDKAAPAGDKAAPK